MKTLRHPALPRRLLHRARRDCLVPRSSGIAASVALVRLFSIRRPIASVVITNRADFAFLRDAKTDVVPQDLRIVGSGPSTID